MDLLNIKIKNKKLFIKHVVSVYFLPRQKLNHDKLSKLLSWLEYNISVREKN